jgi:hypothetical protein
MANMLGFNVRNMNIPLGAFDWQPNSQKTELSKEDVASTCAKCKKKITTIQFDMFELKYHGNCFRCHKCDLRLSYIIANRVGNEIFCDEHANRRLMFFWQQLDKACDKNVFVDLVVNTVDSKKT